MKRPLILLISILIISVLVAVGINTEVFMPSGTQVTQPLNAKLGYQTHGLITVDAGSATSVKSFTLYNRFPKPASINVTYMVSPATGLTITLPSLPITILAKNLADVCVTYGGQEGNYTVTYQISADIIDVQSKAYVELEFDVLVQVILPPEEL